MDEEKKTGLDRIEREPIGPSKIEESLAAAIGQQAAPGVFTGGKQITHTHVVSDPASGQTIMTLWFNDGGAMQTIGHFRCEFFRPGELGLPEESQTPEQVDG